MRRVILTCAGLLTLAATAPAQDATVESIKKAFEKDYAAWLQSYRAATPAERPGLIQKMVRPDAYRKQIWKIVEAAPDTPQAGSGLVWIVQRGARGAEQTKALGLLTKHHVAHHEAVNACKALTRSFAPEAMAFLKAVAQGADDTSTQAVASYALAKAMQTCAAAARRLASDTDGKLTKSYTGFYGVAAVASLAKADPAKLEKKAEAMLERIVGNEKLPDVMFGRRSLAKAAAADLFELQHLTVGREAPDIEGEDVDGITFKLSDYRGKVVMLDFWGDW